MLLPPLINLLHQQLADLHHLLLIVILFQPEESEIGVAIINHLIALGFDQYARLAHDFMTMQGDGRSQARIEKVVTARSKHAV